MNDQEKLNALKQVLTMVFSALTVLAPGLATSQQYSALTTAIITAVPALVTAGSVIWSIYSHRGMKKVPDAATAIILPSAIPGAPPPAPAPVGAVVNLTPMMGVAKVVGALLLGLLLLGSPSAHAQLKPLKPLTGDLAKDLAPSPTDAAPGLPNILGGGQLKKDMLALWQNIQKATGADLTYAIAMATAANKSAPTGITTGAGMRLSCLIAVQTLNGQITGATIVDASGKQLTRPDPAILTDAETFAEVIDAVQPGGPLFTSCAGAAQLAASNTVAFINALMTGAAGLAILAPK